MSASAVVIHYEKALYQVYAPFYLLKHIVCIIVHKKFRWHPELWELSPIDPDELRVWFIIVNIGCNDFKT